MKIPGLRSSFEKVGGIVYFGRMLDKIRLNAAGRLPDGYNVGTNVLDLVRCSLHAVSRGELRETCRAGACRRNG